MRIPKLPFHNVMAELLYSLFFQGECLAYVSLDLSDAAPLILPVPEHARYAVLVIECDTSQFNKDLVARFREDNITPDGANGMPLGDLGVYEIKGTSNMARFALIGVEAGLVHKVRIQFFG